MSVISTISPNQGILSRFRLRPILYVGVFFVSAVIFFGTAQHASAVTRTWDGGGGDDNWSSCANWSADACPGSSDLATFDNTSDVDSYIDGSFAGSIQGLAMNAGYDGTVTMQRSLTVGNGHYTQASGTFTMSSQTMTLSGVTWVDFIKTGGTFNEDTGTVTLSTSWDNTFNVVTTETFYNLTINKSAYGMQISSGDTIVVTGTLTLTDGYISGTAGILDAQGAITQASNFDGGTSVLNFGSASSQTYTINGGITPVLTFDSAVDAADSVVLNANAGFSGINITAGFSGTVPITYNGYGITVYAGDFVQAAGTFNAPASFTTDNSSGFTVFTISGGTFYADNTTWTLVGVYGLVVTLASSLTVGDLIQNGSLSLGSYNNPDTLIVLDDVTLTDGTMSWGVIEVYGDVTQAATYDGVGNSPAVLDMVSASAQTYTTNGGTGHTLTFNSADDASDIVDFNADSRFCGINITAGFSGTVPMTYDGYGLTITDCDYNQAAGTFNAPASMTFLTGGYADFIKTGGTFNEGTGTVTFTYFFANYTTNILVDVSETFYNLVIGVNVYIGTAGVPDTLVVTNDLTLTDGNVAWGDINVHGDVTQASTFDGVAINGSELNLVSASVQTVTINGGTTLALMFDEAADASDIYTFNAASVVCGLNITAGFSGTVPLDYNGFAITIGNCGYSQAAGTFIAPATLNLVNAGYFFFTKTAGTFDGSVSTMSQSGSYGTNMDVDVPLSVLNFTLAQASGSTLTLATGDKIIVTNDFTHTDGLLAGGTLQVNGDVTVATTADGGTTAMIFGGDGDQLYTDAGGNELNGDIFIDKSGGTLTLGSNADWNSTSQDLFIRGNFDQGASYNVTTTAVYIYGANTVWSNTGTGDVTLAGNVYNAGTVFFDGAGIGCGGADSIALVSSAGGSQRTWSGPGIYQVYDITATDMAGTVTVYGSTSSSNNTWTFNSCPSSFTQNEYRWYENADSVAPGAALGAENAEVSTAKTNAVRLRLGKTVGSADLGSNGQKFDLEYATSTSGPWKEVTPGAWWDTDWLSRRKISLNASDLSGSLNDFPVKVTFGAGSIDYAKTKSAGEDLRFVDAGGAALNYEIEQWDETGASVAWVKVPQLDNGTYGDYIWAYYNNTAATDGQAATSVWDSSYRAVWHMDESGANLSDSTSNGKTAAKLSATDPTASSASLLMEAAQNFDGTGDYASVNTPNLPTGDFTYELLFNADTVNDETFFVGSDGAGGNEFAFYTASTDKINIWTNNTSRLTTATALAAGVTNHLAVTRSGSTITAYINGVADANTGTDGGALNFSTCALLLGVDMDSTCLGSLGNYADGRIDEMRVSNAARSPDWLKASASSATGRLARVGEEETSTDHVIYKDNAGVTDGVTLGANLLTSSDVTATYVEGSFTQTNPNAVTNGQDAEWDFSLDPSNASDYDYYFRVKKNNKIAVESYTRYPKLDLKAKLVQQDYQWFANANAVQPGAVLAAENSTGNVTTFSPEARLRMGLTTVTNALSVGKQQFKLQYSTSTGGPWTDMGGVASWWDGSWINRRKITFNNSSSAEALVNFPVLVSLSSGNIDYSKTKDAGQDIRFLDSDGTTLLDHEIEVWNEAGTSQVWVRVPHVDAGSTTDSIYVYYNNTAASDGQDAEGVWNSAYRNIQHFEEASACAVSFTDSTSNNLDGSCVNTPAYTASGRVNGARDFVPGDSDSVLITDATTPTAYTYSAWVKPDDSATLRGIFVRAPSGGPSVGWSHAINQNAAAKFEHYTYDGGTKTVTGTTSVSAGTWYYVAITATNSGSGYLYVNGASEGTPVAVGTLWTGGDRYYVGADSGGTTAGYDGMIDEVRHSNVARSADWVEAEYINMNGAMNSFGGEEAFSTPWIFYDNVTPADGANISSVVLGDSDRTQSYMETGTTPLNINSINLSQQGEWDWSVVAENPEEDTTYYFRMVNSDGTSFNSYIRYPALTFNATFVITRGGSGGSTELGSGGGAPTGGGSGQGGGGGGSP